MYLTVLFMISFFRCWVQNKLFPALEEKSHDPADLSTENVLRAKISVLCVVAISPLPDTKGIKFSSEYLPWLLSAGLLGECPDRWCAGFVGGVFLRVLPLSTNFCSLSFLQVTFLQKAWVREYYLWRKRINTGWQKGRGQHVNKSHELGNEGCERVFGCKVWEASLEVFSSLKIF